MEITKKRLGATAVTDGRTLLGIITDGDLRRMLEKGIAFDTVNAKDIMTINPKTIDAEALAVEALDQMRQHNISQLVVLHNGGYAGLLHLHDLIREGLI
jgi:arabinose-5-phosphate isomerase